MTGFSKIFNATKTLTTNATRFNSTILFKRSGNNLIDISNQYLTKLNSQLLTQTRGSHGRTMFIRPGKFYTKKYFDILHFHAVLAALPFFLFFSYQSIFNGPATLTDIPEGYEPRYWEYHKNPIRRFFAKYLFDIPERAYEHHLHYLYQEQCRIKMRALEQKVRNLMREKQDYKAWYYTPVPKEPMEMKQEYIEKFGNPGYDSKFSK